ncbi:MAG: VPLPA-CTERM sorting domain-containing protein [Desulfosarcina sp.]|nr:VPLPA-CTERM sorting domain-containing protein [Desulfobacterales bacterium]
MKKFTFVLLAMILVLGICAPAHAWFFAIDNADNDLTFDIWFNPEGESLGVDNYQLDFKFDANEIAFDSYSNTPPSGLIGDLMGPPIIAEDSIQNFFAGTFGSGPVLDTLTPLGSLTFALLNPDTSVLDGLDDIWFDTSSENALVTFATDPVNGVPVVGVGGSGLDVGAPVPLPAAVWLLGSGLIGLVGLRRRNR